MKKINLSLYIMIAMCMISISIAEKRTLEEEVNDLVSAIESNLDQKVHRIEFTVDDEGETKVHRIETKHGEFIDSDELEEILTRYSETRRVDPPAP